MPNMFGDATDNVRGRLSGHKVDELNAPAPGADSVAADYIVQSVVGAFGKNLRPDRIDHSQRSFLLEDNDIVYTRKPAQNLRPLFLVQDRPSCPSIE